MGYTNTSGGSIFCVSSLCYIEAVTEVILFAQKSWNVHTKGFCRTHRDSSRGAFFSPVHCSREVCFVPAHQSFLSISYLNSEVCKLKLPPTAELEVQRYR